MVLVVPKRVEHSEEINGAMIAPINCVTVPRTIVACVPKVVGRGWFNFR